MKASDIVNGKSVMIVYHFGERSIKNKLIKQLDNKSRSMGYQYATKPAIYKGKPNENSWEVTLDFGKVAVSEDD